MGTTSLSANLVLAIEGQKKIEIENGRMPEGFSLTTEGKGGKR